jgi:hypothetical protein
MLEILRERLPDDPKKYPIQLGDLIIYEPEKVPPSAIKKIEKA